MTLRGKARQTKLASKSETNDSNMIHLFISTASIVTCLKFLLIPAYYSTDLEVHRNWMAITSTLPIRQWYTESTSQWTLDYPPFFAYFELLLSFFAKWFDPNILTYSAKPYMSPGTLLYMRLTVIVTDLVYYYATYVWMNILLSRKKELFKTNSPKNEHFWTSSPVFIQIVLFLFNIGHLVVDSIHFQYNGLLNGLLLLSMARIVNSQYYWGAFWFAVLLNLKHIYLYCAPAYFFYLFVNVCLRRDAKLSLNITALFKLSSIVLSVFAISYGPFLYTGQISIVFSRLFPFQRGLSHAYWAPNLWALYNTADLVLAKVFAVKQNTSSFTGGLVQQIDHHYLPSITPKHTLLCVILFIMSTSFAYVQSCLKTRNPNRTWHNSQVEFIHLLLLSVLCFFTFGYHVHEKAILLVVPTLIPLIFSNIKYARLFLLLSTIGYYSLFPLLFGPAETFLQLVLFSIHSLFSVVAINGHYMAIKCPLANIESTTSLISMRHFRLQILNKFELALILALLPIHILYTLSPYISIFSHYQFVPLMIISTHCAIGILYCLGRLVFTMPWLSI